MVWTSRPGAAGSPLIEIGDLADAERVEHVELAGHEMKARPVQRLERQRPDVGGLAAPLGDAEPLRQHRVGGAPAARVGVTRTP